MIYKTNRIDGESAVNRWLLEMSKFKSFKPISISVTHGCGIRYAILYSINKQDDTSSEKAE